MWLGLAQVQAFYVWDVYRQGSHAHYQQQLLHHLFYEGSR